MLNVIDKALAEAAAAAREQTEQLLNELNSAGECMLSAKIVFEKEMTEAKKLHELADRKQGEAIRNFDASLIQLHAIIVHLKRQISDGEIVSGIGGATEKQEALEPPEDLPGTDSTDEPAASLKRIERLAKKGAARAA